MLVRDSNSILVNVRIGFDMEVCKSLSWVMRLARILLVKKSYKIIESLRKSIEISFYERETLKRR